MHHWYQRQDHTMICSSRADAEDCPICLSAVEGEGARLHCGHVFHADCIDGWLRLHHTCPICRSDQSTTAPVRVRV